MSALNNAILNDICASTTKEKWSMTQAQEWFDLLKKHDVEIQSVTSLYVTVAEHFDIYKDHPLNTIFGVFSPAKTLTKYAEKRPCVNKWHEIVHLETEHIPEHELQSLELFYCPTCNAFWREP